MKDTPAKGTDGQLIYIHGLDKYMVRVYDGSSGFKDYDILHCDLSIKITDEDASFYDSDDGNKLILDHCPETSGKVSTYVEPAPVDTPEYLALKSAVSALYFADNSDYKSALYSVMQHLSPETAKAFEEDEAATWAKFRDKDNG